MSAEELMDLLKADAGSNDVPQSGVVDDKGARRYLSCPVCVVLLREERQRRCSHAGIRCRSMHRDWVFVSPCCTQVLEQLLDEKYLERSKPAPYPEFGVGYEVVQQLEGSGLLSGIQ